MSGYPEAVNSGQWGKDNFIAADKRTKAVPVLKSENLGEEMTVDEKMIDEEFYTVLTNRQTGKIALLAETLQVKDLSDLTAKMGSVVNEVKEITMDLSPTYEKYATQCFPKATVVADKFHVVKHIPDFDTIILV